MKVEKFSNREDRPEPPEPSAPKTDVTDEEVAVETDMVEGSTLREALEAQVESDGQVYGNIYGEINRLEEENEELKQEVRELREAVGELTRVVREMARHQGVMREEVGKARGLTSSSDHDGSPLVELDNDRVILE
jgi:chromosome segregation ATPase